MGKVNKFSVLVPLAQLKADLAGLEFTKAHQRVQALEAELSRLIPPDMQDTQDIAEAQAAVLSSRWRVAQRRTLLTELAKARADAAPFKQALAKAAAQKGVLEKLADLKR